MVRHEPWRRSGILNLRAPAKLNLRLRILGRSEDGFHSIETLFLRLGLADEVTIDQNEAGLQLTTSGIGGVPDGEDNLCWKAADGFFGAIGRKPAASIRLVKHIPVAAGLGGGSSDAAAVLIGLNRIHDCPLNQSDLMKLADNIGSDVPFFLTDARFALGWERGGRLLPLEPPPSRAVLIVVPDFGVSAGKAYAWFGEDLADASEPSSVSPGQLPPVAALSDWAVLAGLAQNDLADPVCRRHPELRVATESLINSGAEIAIMCGSGACVAGIFRTTVQRDSAAAELRENQAIPAEWGLVSTSSDCSVSPKAAG